MLKRMNGALLLVAAALLGACSADHDLGGEKPNDQDPGPPDWYPQPAQPDGGGAPEVGALGSAQSWTGYVEHTMFPSGSDVIKLTFATDSAGTAVGTIVFGQGTSPPPATDPDVRYPPSLDVYKITGYTWWFLAEGHPYAFSGTLEGDRLRFQAPFAQLWTDWCALQTSYPPGQCVPYAMSTSTAPDKCEYKEPKGQWTTVDCGKFMLCGSSTPCVCGPTGCQASPDRVGKAIFDIQLSADMATGTASGTFTGNAHFTKVP